LANAYNVQGALGELPPSETLPKAKQAAEKALKLDDTLAEAHTALGGVELLFERNWPSARDQFERAIELNPGFPNSQELYGYYWEVAGNLEKAQDALEHAQKLGPLLTVIRMDLAGNYYYQGRYDEAIASYRRAHEIDPDFVPLPFIVGQAYERKGMYDQAIAECERVLAQKEDDQAALSALTYAYARAGKTTEAATTLRRLTALFKSGYVSPFLVAVAYAGLRDNDSVMIWLNRAYDGHDPQLIWLAVERQLDDLHDDPRFKDLLQRMNIKL